MAVRISAERISAALVNHIQDLSRQNLLACYQCGKCSAGCPVANHMDILPAQIIRMAQLGMTEPLLDSKSIWTCVSCMTCNYRCPKGIRIAEIIDSLRQVKLRKGEDRLVMEEIALDARADVPPIALIGAMRKLTS